MRGMNTTTAPATLVQPACRRAPGRRPGHQRRRRRQAHARADAEPAAPARPLPDARRLRHRQPGRLHRRLPRPPAPRLRDRDLHARRPHAPPRLGRQRGPAVRRRRAVDDRRPRRHPQRDARAGGRPHGRLPAVAQPAGASDKMCPPWYRDIPAAEIPELRHARRRRRARHRRAAARAWPGRCSARPPSRCTWTWRCRPARCSSSRCRQRTTPSSTSTAARWPSAGRRCRASAWPSWPTRRAATACACRAGPKARARILIAGQPLNEPIAQYGPFVMNSNEEIFQAVEDFRAGRLA